MNITIGVDDLERATLSIEMLEALQFPVSQLNLVHVSESFSNTLMSSTQKQDLITKYNEMVDKEATQLLTAIEEVLKKREVLTYKSFHLKGFISNKLLEHADSKQSDLVVLTSSGKGTIEGLLIGSTVRKVSASAKQSVLVVKPSFSLRKKLTAVFATDHSPYSLRCLDELLRMAPKGISRLVIVTILPRNIKKEMNTMTEQLDLGVEDLLRKGIEKANLEVCLRLKSISSNCTSRLEVGKVSEALSTIMKEELADLLIIGAQGHGWLDRITLGSVSFDQVVKHPYSVLILRT